MCTICYTFLHDFFSNKKLFLSNSNFNCMNAWIFQLEYTIELTEEGRAKQGSSDYYGWNNYQDGNRRRYVSQIFPQIQVSWSEFFIGFDPCANTMMPVFFQP